jgi:hypothetical protein
MKVKKIFILLFLIFLSCFIVYDFCMAETPANPPPTNLIDPLGGKLSSDPNAPQILIGNIINAAMGLVGSIALAMFIYGGFIWMMAAGNSEAITKGKNILIWATLGLVIIFSAYALVQFVFTGIGLTGAT